MSSKTKRYPILITLKVSPELKTRLEERAKEMGVSASEFIRRMISLK